MTASVETVERFIEAFIAAWPKADALSLEAFFAPDAVYHNMPMDPINGRDAIVATLGSFMEMGGRVEVDVLQLVSEGPIVMTERVDRFITEDKTIALPVTGVFEVSDRLIRAWRDYFDLGHFRSQMQQGGVPSGAAVPDQVNLVVADMEATIAFYRRLGLTIPDTVPEFASHHRSAQLDAGVALDFDSVDFARHWDKGWRGGMGVLGFKVGSRERVDELYADLTGAGYRSQQEPWDAFWGARYAVVEDPDGNPVGIMSPIDPDRRSDPGFP